MNKTDTLTIELLKRHIPAPFVDDRLSYFDILQESYTQFPSSNWDSFIENIYPLQLTPRMVFLDNNYSGVPGYPDRYEAILKEKTFKGRTYLEWAQEFHENNTFEVIERSRSRYDTINECLTILKYIDTDKPFTILDIGGGYGRMAEYFLRYPNCTMYTADTFVIGTIYSEWYLSHVIPEKDIKWLNSNTRKRLNFIATSDIDYYINQKDIKFDFVVNVHSMDEMNIATITKLLPIINVPKKCNYVYLKGHFVTYNLAKNTGTVEDWTPHIPANWQLLENNLCPEDIGIAPYYTHEKIFKVNEK
jgi:hypothetical protein